MTTRRNFPSNKRARLEVAIDNLVAARARALHPEKAERLTTAINNTRDNLRALPSIAS